MFDRTEAVTAQDIQTIYDGLAIFMAQPLFGSGLGAYIHDQATTTRAPLVIHSTAVWLLAEAGLVGLWFSRRPRSGCWPRRSGVAPAALMLPLTLCVFGVISMAQEMLSQRGSGCCSVQCSRFPPMLPRLPWASLRPPVNAATV